MPNEECLINSLIRFQLRDLSLPEQLYGKFRIRSREVRCEESVCLVNSIAILRQFPVNADQASGFKAPLRINPLGKRFIAPRLKLWCGSDDQLPTLGKDGQDTTLRPLSGMGM